MPTFRLLNQAPQYLLADGSVNAGGSLTFYETDLTTLQDTWSDPEKNTLNANPVVLDAAGRASTDIWLDGEYGVVLKDADDVVIWTRNNVEIPGGTGTSLPAPEADKFVYSPDGVSFVMAPILQVPDPTSLQSYVLTSDGTGVPIWQLPAALPDIPDPDIVVGDLSFQAGTSDVAGKFFMQAGMGSAPASGGMTTSTTITFPVPFASLWGVAITLNVTTVSTGTDGRLPVASVTGWVQGSAASSVTAYFRNMSDGDIVDSSDYITSAVTFSWIAFGKRTVA